MDHQEVRTWRNNAKDLGFAFSLPRNVTYKNLSALLVMRRYRHPGSPDDLPVHTTLFNCIGKQKMLAEVEFLLPHDDRWHLFTFDIVDRLQDVAHGLMSVVIDDSKNFLSVDAHYGCSICSATLVGEEDERLHPMVSLKHEHATPESRRETLSAEALLVICPVWDIQMPPISVAGISSYLRANGVDVQVVDFNIDSFFEAKEDEVSLWHGYAATRWDSPDFVDKVSRRFSARVEELTDRIACSPAPASAPCVYEPGLHQEVRLLLRRALLRALPQAHR